MILNTIQQWMMDFIYVTVPVLVILAYLLFRVTRLILARIAYFIALRSKNVYDDLQNSDRMDMP